MSTTATTGSDQVIYLFDKFNGKPVSLTSVGGRAYYVKSKTKAELANITIRSTQSDISASGYSAGYYTVADSSLFRIGDNIEVLDSGTRQGNVMVVSKPTPTTIGIEVVSEVPFTPAGTNVLRLEKDSFFTEDSASEIETDILNL